LSSDFDLLIAIGVHSMAGTRYGCMNHTLSIDTIMNIWINGVVVGELGIWAAAAGHYGVPIGMLSGDYWAVEEAKTLLGHVIGVPVKKGINRYTAECYNLDESRQQIKEAARMAVAMRHTFKPYILTPPVEVKIEYTNTFHADKAEMGGAERLNGRTVRHTGNDFPSVYARFS
ncbi:MAG: M55 family metallopeptidase, partial [Clostridia bacterium]|nr:M55 family metallopeptidase [Clostridia bacterium]